MKKNWLRPNWPQNNDPFDDGKDELRQIWPIDDNPFDDPFSNPIPPRPPRGPIIDDPPDRPQPRVIDTTSRFPKAPPIKLFFIGGSEDKNARGTVYEYTQIFAHKFRDELSTKIENTWLKPNYRDTEFKFLTLEKAESKVWALNHTKDYNYYAAIIGHGVVARSVLMLVQKIIKLNTLILIDPFGRGISWKKDFNPVLSKIDKEHFKVKFINFTDFTLDWGSIANGNEATYREGRWDLAYGSPIKLGQGTTEIYRKLTKLGYSKYDLLSKIKCNHADFCVMFKQCEDWLLNDIEKFMKAYRQRIDKEKK